MKKAYANLRASRSGTPELEVEPTHVYMRFLPKNDAEWALLKSDTSITLYDYPLDYEIENPGTYYHDPTLADSAITYQYCVLPINYTFPNIPSELLYHVYLPEAEGAISGRANDAKSQLLIDMEYEAVRLTGNLSQSGNSGGRVQALLPSRWTPKGTITVWDDFLGRQIPVEGAEVHARWFTNIATAITDANGYFGCNGHLLGYNLDDHL